LSRVDELIYELCPEGVEFLPIGGLVEILDHLRKPITRSSRAEGEYPYFGANGIQDWVDGWIFDGTFLLLGEDGSVLREDGSPVLTWAEGKIWVNNHAHVLRAKSPDLLLRFAFHYLETANISALCSGGSRVKLTQASLRKIPVPIPPLPVQKEIVRILDTFTELKAELEAELEARTTQHEETRNRLMAFDVLEGHSVGIDS